MSQDAILIENMIFKGLLRYEDYARKVLPFLETRYFSTNANRKLFDIYQTYFNKHNDIPTIEILAAEINEIRDVSDDDIVAIGDVLSYVIETKDDIINDKWLFEKTEEHARAVLLEKAILKTIKLNEDNDATNKEGQILALYEEVSALSFDSSVGMALYDDAERRFEEYMKPEDILPFKLNIFNNLFGGGGRRKTLACLVGKTNIGKSLHLCHHAADFVRCGYNVVYFSGEMSERMTYERIDSNLTNIPIENFRDQKLDKEKYINALLENKKTNGNLVVKEFPTKGASVAHMSNVLRELRQKRKFKADIVIIDYLNLFNSKKKIGGDNLYSEIKTVSEEIRGMCVEENVFGLTATQLNRSGSKNQDSADETSVSDSYGISMTMDVLIGIFDTPELIEQNLQGLSLWKTRFSKKTDIASAFVKVDWDHMRLYEQTELTEAINGRSNSANELVKAANGKATDETPIGKTRSNVKWN